MGARSELIVVCIHFVNKKILIKKYAGYALKDVAVHYIMQTNPAVFERLDRTWDGDESSYCHV